METYVIELADADIKVARSGEIVLRSPGYALINDDQVEVGESAYNQARLHPRRSHNQFWHRLSLDALNNPTPYYRHHADLVHAHLKHIAERIEDTAEVIFAVPGSYSKEQLSLLLGVAQESPLQVVGLVDMATAAAAMYPLHHPSYYLDIYLHQAVINRLDVTDRITRGKVVPVKGLGLVKLYDRWVQLIADAFIEQCRFDPLHNAETEQALYRQLPQWLKAIGQQPEVLLEIESAANRFQARLIQEQVIARAMPFYEQLKAALTELDAAVPLQLMVSERLAHLPGISTLLPSHQVVSELAFYRGCEQHMDLIHRGEQAISFVTALPASEINRDASAPQPPVETAAPGAVATHILLGYRAYPLIQTLYVGTDPAGELQISREREQLPTIYCALSKEGDSVTLNRFNDQQVRVNGAALADDGSLKVGDRLHLGDHNDGLILISEA